LHVEKYINIYTFIYIVDDRERGWEGDQSVCTTVLLFILLGIIISPTCFLGEHCQKHSHPKALQKTFYLVISLLPRRALSKI
jgi:hypothetical protein